MKVAFVNSVVGRGGAGKVGAQLSAGLQRMGHETHSLAWRIHDGSSDCTAIQHSFGGPWSRVAGTIDHAIARAGGTRRGTHHMRELFRLASSGAARKARRAGLDPAGFPGSWHLLEQLPFAPDVVHLHNLHGHFFDLEAVAPLSRSVPVVWTLHDEWALTGRCTWTLGCGRWRESCGACPQVGVTMKGPDGTEAGLRHRRRVYEQAVLHVVTPSTWLADRVRDSVMSPASLTVIPNGVDLHRFAPRDRDEARHRLGLPSDRPIVLFVANHADRTPWKGLDTLAAALRRLTAMGHGNVLLLALGDDGRGDDRFSGLPVRSVPFVRDEDEVANYYAAADVYVHAAAAENAPLVILEAMASGLAIAALDAGGISEQLGSTAEIGVASQGDIAGFVDRIAEFVSNRAFAREIGSRNRRRAERHYGLDSMVQQYEQLYGKVIR